MRFRLLVLMVGLTTVPVLILTWVAVGNTRNSVEAQIVDANLTRVRWATQYLEEVLLRFDDVFYSLQIDESFTRILDEVERQGNSEGEAVQREIRRVLTGAYYSYSALIDQLTLYLHETGQAVTLDNVTSGLITYPDLQGPIWNGVAEEPVPLSIRRSNGRLYAVHTVNRFADQSLRGALVARIDDSFSRTVLEILESAGNSEIYLLNDTWDVVISEPSSQMPRALRAELQADLRETLSPVVTRTDTTLRFSQAVAGSRLVVVKSVPRSVIAGSASDTILAGLFAGGLLAAISLVLSVVFSFRISRPIAELAQSMQHATVPSFDQMRGQSRDDVRLLQEGYEALTLRMKNLVQKEYEQEMELKQAHLLALQAQINPHFLNNTLNLLGGMAMAKGVPEVYAIARAMGDMFRYAAGGEGDLVTLNQEVTHTRNYLLIQEHRFAGRCSTTVRVDPEILTTPIPRFTLQPLVENAFEHGLQGKKGEWNVTIRGCRQTRGTMVVVQDNGTGMSHDSVSTLRAGLRHELHETRSTRSIGLRNVNARLRLHFGDGFGLRIFSLPKEGTRVVVVLPNANRRGVTE